MGTQANGERGRNTTFLWKNLSRMFEPHECITHSKMETNRQNLTITAVAWGGSRRPGRYGSRWQGVDLRAEEVPEEVTFKMKFDGEIGKGANEWTRTPCAKALRRDRASASRNRKIPRTAALQTRGVGGLGNRSWRHSEGPKYVSHVKKLGLYPKGSRKPLSLSRKVMGSRLCFE